MRVKTLDKAVKEAKRFHQSGQYCAAVKRARALADVRR